MEEKSLKELREELVANGMPESDVAAFNTKGQIIAVLNTMKTKETIKRVDSLEEKVDPKEEKKFEQNYLSKARIMRDLLMAQPMVRTLLPCTGSETQGTVEWRTDKKGEKYQFHVSGSIETVQLNGFKYIIPKGTYYDVPQQISDVLEKSYKTTSGAGRDKSLDRVDPSTGRPMSESL